jgi:hypothetical protein
MSQGTAGSYSSFSEAEIRRTEVESQLSKQFVRSYLKKTHHKKGLVE